MSGSINVDHAIGRVIASLSAMSDISQGSVTTSMRFDGNFSVNITTNFLLIPSVKKC